MMNRQTDASVLIVEYGRSGFLGAFTLSDENPAGAPITQLQAIERGSMVLVQSPRGSELGTVLAVVDAAANLLDPAAGGSCLRVATSADIAIQQKNRQREQALQAQAAELLAAEPVLVTDAELLHDGATLILHLLAWERCELDATLAELAQRLGVAVRVLDVSQMPTLAEPKASASCGSGGCGSGGGGCSSCGSSTTSTSNGSVTRGCSSGSCSKGKIKSSEELTAYFAELRKKMEAEVLHRRPLN